MRLLYEFDFVSGTSALHDELVRTIYLRQLGTYRAILGDGYASGETVDAARTAMLGFCEQIGCGVTKDAAAEGD